MEIGKQSAALTAFYRAWLDWVDAGAPRSQPFARYFGLCDALSMFAIKLGQVGEFSAVRLELRAQFEAAGLCPAFPFGKYEWQRDWHLDKMHECEKRIAWVKARIEEA